MSEKPNLEQMLKLWSKKDLWNRIQEKNKQISGLEAKLEAREEAIKYLKGIKRYDIGEMLTENTKLKQQLAEKDEQIETQKSNIEFLYDLFVSPQGEQTLKAINQDKISFAVEQLEKVKEFNSQRVFSSQPINDYIDNQIKQLKEG